MKTLKKMMALMIAVVMCMAMTVTAFAGSGATNTHTITVHNADEIGPHTYEAYQVFVGDYDTTSNKVELTIDTAMASRTSIGAFDGTTVKNDYIELNCRVTGTPKEDGCNHGKKSKNDCVE